MMRVETAKYGMEPVQISAKTHHVERFRCITRYSAKMGPRVQHPGYWVFNGTTTAKEFRHRSANHFIGSDAQHVRKYYDGFMTFEANYKRISICMVKQGKQYGFCRFIDPKTQSVIDYLVNEQHKIDRVIRCFLVNSKSLAPDWIDATKDTLVSQVAANFGIKPGASAFDVLGIPAYQKHLND